MDHPSSSGPKTCAPSSFPFSASVFWTTLLAALEASEVRYCVSQAQGSALHPSAFVVDPSDRGKLGKIFSEVRHAGFRAVRSVKIRPGRHRVVFAKPDTGAMEAIELEFCTPADWRSISENRLTTRRLRSWFSTRWQALTGSGVRDGAFVVFLGPDGVGKTTLLTSVTTALAPLFERQHFFRWRPAMFARAPRPDAPPHSKPRRSCKGLAFLPGIFVAGFCRGIFVSHAEKCCAKRADLVVYDRYYHDVLVDPRRYRYDGPRWLARLAGRLVPPKSTLSLLCSTRTSRRIFARKQQLAVEDIRELRNLYRQFAKATPFSIVVATDRPLEQCTRRGGIRRFAPAPCRSNRETQPGVVRLWQRNVRGKRGHRGRFAQFGIIQLSKKSPQRLWLLNAFKY